MCMSRIVRVDVCSHVCIRMQTWEQTSTLILSMDKEVLVE